MILHTVLTCTWAIEPTLWWASYNIGSDSDFRSLNLLYKIVWWNSLLHPETECSIGSPHLKIGSASPLQPRTCPFLHGRLNDRFKTRMSNEKLSQKWSCYHLSLAYIRQNSYYVYFYFSPVNSGLWLWQFFFF